MSKLPTIAMTPMPEYGYDPIPLILSGEKVHTLRKQRNNGDKEVTVNSKRTGIIIRFSSPIALMAREFLTDEFAYADGFRNPYPACDLEDLMYHFYGEVPEAMWCSYFKVVQRPEEETE